MPPPGMAGTRALAPWRGERPASGAAAAWRWGVAARAAVRQARRRFGSAPLWSIAVVLAAVSVILAPLVSLLRTALSGGLGIWGGLVGNVLPAALLETAALLAGVAILAGATGVGTAWLVTAHRFPGRSLFAWLLPLPLAVPAYVTAYVYVEILDAAGPVQVALRSLFGWASRNAYWFPEIRSLGGCILVMSAVLYPYVYLAARTMFLTQGASILEAARTLGVGPSALFRTVALPLARPALAVGLALALLEALNDIGASEYLGVRTLTVSVYTTWLNRGSLAGAAQIACVMLALVTALLWLERRGRRDRRYGASGRSPRVAAPAPLARGAGFVATLFCAVPVALGFVVPVLFLLGEVLQRELVATVGADFSRALAATVGLALAATIATLLLGIVVTTAARLARHRLGEMVKLVLSLGYAVPGTVLALGLLGPLVAIDGALNALWRGLAGEKLGLVVMGSALGIVAAYTIRFLPIATGSLAAGLDRVSAGIDDAARTLGARPRDLVLRVQLPLLRPALASAGLLVFVDCLKELPATLLLRPLNTETLATLVYGAAARGSFEEGSLAALVIVFVGLGPVIRLTRGAEPRRSAPS